MSDAKHNNPPVPPVSVSVPAQLADAVRATVKRFGELAAERVPGSVTLEVHVRGDGAPTAFNTNTKRVGG